ncbi:HlyD family efflux transporter periplasmic adaptor subunit [Rhizobium terrae]|uniref:HlyD family efflux transporter periplasmic adaptor subunit n=1 Tax=Rhizobium terrae TaxID=2171756 RepID=UPI000E3C8878|nr:HlyD family efflux transporter periplasmic adaptor subunit [Rhizobium terrae]
MIEVVKNSVALPLEDPGKGHAPVFSSHGREHGSWWRGLLLAGSLLGVGMIAGIYLQPLVMRMVLELAGLDPVQSSAVTVPQQEESQPMPGAAASDVVALGRLVPNGGTLAVTLPNGAGDARIARLMVSEGERVEAGQTIAELDNMPALLAARASAGSNLAAQQAALEQVRASTLASLAEARANHAAAEATLTLANQELERQGKLAAGNSTTQVLFDQARANAVKARAELGRTAALVERYGGAETGNQSDILLAARNLDLARANLARADEDLAAARVVAPRAGIVLEIHTRVGGKPSAAGVVTIGDIAQMTAELEVYQADIKQVALGQITSMTAQALPAPLTGKVTRIGQIVGRQSVMSTEPAANADARVVRVTVTLDADSSARAGSYTNLEVIGRIGTKTE